jgi:2-deoxy-D-gluconate 3-dehydrogenase
MRKLLLTTGLLALAVGLLWIGQGTGAIAWPASSFMIGSLQWAGFGRADPDLAGQALISCHGRALSRAGRGKRDTAMKTGLFDLSGKVAIVTGGNGGIGLGMAQGLADAGATIAVVGRNEAKSKEAAAALEQRGGKAIAVTADVTDKAAVAAMAERVSRELGRIDILVNNAGINIRKPPHTLEIGDWDSVIATNLTSAFLCSQAAYPAMKAAGGGKIINIGSMMSIFGASFAPAYAASKGGIVQFTRSCACAWARDNIQANAILPGWIDTDLTKRAREEIDGLHDRVLARTPAARWGAIADFAGIAVFLASPASDFVTGTAIPVDGGYSIMG